MDTLIVGAGGHGRVVLEVLRAQGKYTPAGFIDANPDLAGTQVNGVPVLGHINTLPRLKQRKLRHAIIAIGDNAARVSYAQVMREHGFELISAIHPSTVISPTATIGSNVVVCATAVVGTDSRIADSCIINTGAIVDHECSIAEGVHVAPGVVLAGRVTVEAQAFLGLGSKVIPCLSIGSRAIVGAGAVVIRDVPANVTVVGVPARALERQPG